jgi:hypothetical protein
MFITFLVFLIGGSILPIILFSSGELLGVVGLAVPSRPTEKSGFRRGIGYGRIAIQTYIWLGWAAYCAWLALRFGLEPDVEHPRVYHAVALLATSLPIAYLTLTSWMYAASDEERGQLHRGINLWRVLLFFGFCAFLVAPGLMNVPYAWLIHAQEVAVGDATPSIGGTLRAAESLLIPSSDHPPYIADRAEPVRVPGQSAFVIPKWRSGQGSGVESAVAPCDEEGNEPLPEVGNEADDPCADEAETGVTPGNPGREDSP